MLRSEIITASQIQVTRREVQLRCSSQPMGLLLSFQRIQRRKTASQKTGVVKVRSSHSLWADGGSSRQRRRTFLAAIWRTQARVISERAATDPAARRTSNWLAVGIAAQKSFQNSLTSVARTKAAIEKGSRDQGMPAKEGTADEIRKQF